MRSNTGFIHEPPEVDIPSTVAETGKSVLEVTAADLAKSYGPSLVGRRVWTVPYGGWPGGAARVVKMGSQTATPDIVFYVEGLENFKYPEGDKMIGVFDHERCYLLTETSA